MPSLPPPALSVSLLVLAATPLAAPAPGGDPPPLPAPPPAALGDEALGNDPVLPLAGPEDRPPTRGPSTEWEETAREEEDALPPGLAAPDSDFEPVPIEPPPIEPAPVEPPPAGRSRADRPPLDLTITPLPDSSPGSPASFPDGRDRMSIEEAFRDSGDGPPVAPWPDVPRPPRFDRSTLYGPAPYQYEPVPSSGPAPAGGRRDSAPTPRWDGVWDTTYASVTGHLVRGEVRLSGGGGTILGGEGRITDVTVARATETRDGAATGRATGNVVVRARWTMNDFAGTLAWTVSPGAEPGAPPRFTGEWRLTAAPPGTWRTTGAWSGTRVTNPSPRPNATATILADPPPAGGSYRLPGQPPGPPRR